MKAATPPRMDSPRSSKSAKGRGLTGALLAVALAASACGGTADGGSPGNGGGEELIPLNIGFPTAGYYPLFVARDQGLFREAGFEPQFFQFDTGAPLLAGLDSESLDVVVTGLATAFAVGQDIPLEIMFWEIDDAGAEGMNASTASGIESFKDLGKAKSIGAATGTCSEVALVSAAEAAGLDPKDLPIRNVPPPLQPSAFQSGDLDAAFAWAPYTYLNEDAGAPRVSVDGDYGGVCPVSWAARPDFLKEYPEAGARLAEARDLALDMINDDPSLAVDSLMTSLRIEQTLAERILEEIPAPTFEEMMEEGNEYSLHGEGGLAGQLSQATRALAATGSIPDALTTDQLEDTVNPEHVQQYMDEKQN